MPVAAGGTLGDAGYCSYWSFNVNWERGLQAMSADHHKREGTGSDKRERRANGQPIRGITRLVNPPEDDQEAVSGEVDPVERDYLGRILHVADRALRQGKDGQVKDEVFRRTRRGRVH